MKTVVIFGAAAHGRVIKDILLSNENEYNIIGFIDNTRNIGDMVDGTPVIGRQNELNKLEDEYGEFSGIIAVGDNYLREKVASEICIQLPSFKFINAIHKNTIISKSVSIGIGNVLMPGVIVNSQAVIHNHTIINTMSSLEHNCTLEDFASISAGVITGGYVQIGSYSSIALGVTIFDRIRIGANVVVGSGSLVTKDITDNVLVYGVPAKVIRTRNAGERFLK